MEKWFIKNKKADFNKIGQTFHISPITARLLVNRDLQTEEQMRAYLFPSVDGMHNPSLLKDMGKACAILEEKISQGATIRVIGDYDVDGVMATYILYQGLKQCGAKVDFEIPDRILDGYGINIHIIDGAYHDEVDTIITCDNGIAATEQIAYAKSLGMTVIITDHHDVPFTEDEGGVTYHLPNADGVVNPKQQECTYPFENICGAFVAYKLIEMLYEHCLGEKAGMEVYLQCAAIATVCDVMDLVEENRILVKAGLEALQMTQNVGLRALLEVTGLLGKNIGVYHLGFVIGPCINASGRLESAKLGLRLLLESEESQAAHLAVQLKELNEARKKMTLEGLEQALIETEQPERIKDKVLVVYLSHCHESLAGIIAGRIREKYQKPAIVLTKAEKGVKGSGRSIEGYHMFQELSRCKDILDKFGGHPMAAGLSLKEENITLLRERLNQQTELTEEDFIPKISFDMVLPLTEVSIPFIKELSLLEPYGKGNGKPLFGRKEVSIRKAIILGAGKNVLKLTVADPQGGNLYTAMLFQKKEEFEKVIVEKYGKRVLEDLYKKGTKEVFLDILYYPDINEYNGYQNMQIMIQHFR